MVIENQLDYNRHSDKQVIGNKEQKPDFKFEHLFNGFRLNTVQTARIFCVVSQDEIQHVYPETDSDCLISITEPDRPNIDCEIIDRFKTVLETKFYDVTEEHERLYKLKMCGDHQIQPIPHDEANKIKEFILANHDKRFAVHCAAGISRSAAVAEAIVCLLDYKGDVYRFRTGDNPIKRHWRYYPNPTVFDRILGVESTIELPKSNFVERDSGQ